ncbi:hypothetical protein [Dyadobacter sp. CY347]|uniref:hypothetical protein n=1 Tax=Dyadobacter sp. CY347 TaxID=2909336 RepID=UPI001F3CB60A|nr:hypothetical protein [Dyadobacter sp. CY347]MCF2489150.1 hypothetical protein [Dyadobacter sp. CY347]
MEVSFETFYQVLKEKSILYFSLNYQGNPDPHYYVLLDKGTEILLFSVCTSKLDTILNYVKRRNLDYDTIVFIQNEPDKPFSKNTYINCNSPVSIPVEDFKKMFNEGKIKYKDQLDDEHFELIINGILKSRLVERKIKKLFL